jgi:hypothetical protein
MRVRRNESMSILVSAGSHPCFLIARQLYRYHRNARADVQFLATVLSPRAGNRDLLADLDYRRVGFRAGWGRK